MTTEDNFQKNVFNIRWYGISFFTTFGDPKCLWSLMMIFDSVILERQIYPPRKVRNQYYIKRRNNYYTINE